MMINNLYVNHPKLWAEYLASVYNQNQNHDLFESNLFKKDQKKCLRYFMTDQRWSILLFIMNNYYCKKIITRGQLFKQTGISRPTIHRVISDATAESWLHNAGIHKTQSMQVFEPSQLMIDLWCNYTKFRVEHIAGFDIHQSINLEVWRRIK